MLNNKTAPAFQRRYFQKYLPLHFLLCTFMLILPHPHLEAQTVNNRAVFSYRDGTEALNQNRLLDSIQHFQEALEYNANYSDAYRELARAFYFLGELDEAELYIRQALDLAPSSSQNLNLYGRILITGGRVDEAESVFMDIISMERFNVDARIGLGELSAARGNIIQAGEYYQASLELSPEDHRILLSLAFIYWNQGQLNRAEDYVIAAVDSDSQNPWTYFYAAEFYILSGNASEAERYALIALSLQPDFIPGLEILSRVYVQIGKYREAVSVLNRLDLNDLVDDELMLYTRALAEYNSGSSNTALTTLESRLRDNPDDEVARFLLEDILINEKDFNDQQRLFHANFHFTRAGEYLQRNQREFAQYHYNRGLTLAPFSLEGRRFYARFFRETGEYARYLSQLEFLRDQLGFRNINLDDDYEIYTALLRDSVSNDWNTMQFLSERLHFKLAVFVLDDSRTLHAGLDKLIAGRFMDQLYTSARVEFATPPGVFSLQFEPIQTGSEAEAFATSRAEKADYYLFFEVDEREDTIELEVNLHLGRTGRQLQTFTVIRSGITRLKDSILQLSTDFLQALPVQGSILKRNFETALINLGRSDGLSTGDTLSVIKPADLSFHHENLNFTYEQDEIVGTAMVLKTDVLLSNVELDVEGFFDRINIGDTVFLVSDESPDPENSISSNNLQLYERIRTIR